MGYVAPASQVRKLKAATVKDRNLAMANEPTDVTVTDTIPEDLDDFTDLFNGSKKEVVEEPEAEVEPDETDPVSEGEDEKVETTDEPEGDPDEDEPEEPAAKKPKKSNPIQERISELTARAREAERALEALKAETQKQAEAAKATDQIVQTAGPSPDALNEDGSDKYPLGEFDPAYIRDMARHTIDQEWNARKAQEQQEQTERQAQEAREALHNTWVEKLDPVTEKYDDFLDKTVQLETAFDGLDPAYSDYLVQTIKSLDYGPEVLYYFANNLDEAQKLVQSGPLSATLALGEINAMFKSKPKQASPKVTQAPPPPQVNKGSKTRVAVSGDTDDLDLFASVFFKGGKS